jgi:hypothetical protein
VSFEVPAGGAVSAGWTNVDIDLDPVTGELLIGDFSNGRVVRTTQQGAYVSALTGLAGSNILQMAKLAKDGSGDVWISRYNTPNGSLRRFNSSGVLQQTISPTPGVNGPNAGGYIDVANNLLWTTWEDGTIRPYDLTTGALGTALAVTGVPGTTPLLHDGLAPDPSDPTNFFYITVDSTPATICKVNRSTGAVSTFCYVPISPEGIIFTGNGKECYVCFDQGFHNGYTGHNIVYRMDADTGVDLDGNILAQNVGIPINSGSTLSSYSGTIRPSANRLQLMWIMNSRTTTPASIPVPSSTGQTWTQVGTFLESGQQRRITLFCSTCTSAPGSNTLTVTFGGVSQTGCNVFLTEVWGYGIDLGNNGQNSIVQNSGSVTAGVGAEGSGTTSGLTLNLSALSSPSNFVVAAIRNNTTASITQGSNFLNIANLTTTIGGCVAFGQGNVSVPWTWGSQTVTSRATGVEIRTRAWSPRALITQAVQRAAAY